MKKFNALLITILLSTTLVGCSLPFQTKECKVEATIKSVTPTEVVFVLSDGSLVSGFDEETCENAFGREGDKVHITVDITTTFNSNVIYKNARF